MGERIMEPYQIYHWIVDWDKVNTLEDVKSIIKAIQFSWENPPDDIIHLLKTEDKYAFLVTPNTTKKEEQ